MRLGIATTPRRWTPELIGRHSDAAAAYPVSALHAPSDRSRGRLTFLRGRAPSPTFMLLVGSMIAMCLVEHPAARVGAIVGGVWAVMAGRAKASATTRQLHRAMQRQEALAVLGRRAVEGMPLPELLGDVVALTAAALEADAVVVLAAERHEGMAGARGIAHLNWPGSTDWVPVAADSQAAYILNTDDSAVAVDDYDEALPFVPAQLLVANGVRCSLSARIGRRLDAYGLIGAYRTSPRPFDPEDTAFLVEIAAFLALVVDRQRHEERLEELANHDPLTRLANRRVFTSYLQADPPPTAVAIFDLDGFKDVNDTDGHAAGDRVLETVARRLLALARPTDVVARLGGDEFALIVPAPEPGRPHEPLEAITARAETMRRAITEPVPVDGRLLHVGASAGVAHCTSTTHLARHADAALYDAKRAGRGLTRVYEPARPLAVGSGT